MPDVVTKEDHPDFIGGIVWSACELRWINERIQAEVIAERERCAQYLRDAAERLAPEGKRTTQVDRHCAYVLACKGDEIADGMFDKYSAACAETIQRRGDDKS